MDTDVTDAGAVRGAAARTWRSPVSFEAPAMAALLQEALDALGYLYTRKRGERLFSETISLDPNERGTPAWRFFVEHPTGFVLETYDTRPRKQGRLGHLEVHAFRAEDEPMVRRVLQRVTDLAPHAPWSFSFDQRMTIGPLSSTFRDARRAWRPVAADEPLVTAEV